MKTLKVDNNNNFVISQNRLQIIQEKDACEQDTKTRIRLCKGEDFDDVTKGIDYFNEALGEYTGKNNMKDQIRNRILDSSEIDAVETLELERLSGIVEKERADGSTYTENQNDTIDLNSNMKSIYGDFEL